jgi:hypothetical protein
MDKLNTSNSILYDFSPAILDLFKNLKSVIFDFKGEKAVGKLTFSNIISTVKIFLLAAKEEGLGLAFVKYILNQVGGIVDEKDPKKMREKFNYFVDQVIALNKIRDLKSKKEIEKFLKENGINWQEFIDFANFKDDLILATAENIKTKRRSDDFDELYQEFLKEFDDAK